MYYFYDSYGNLTHLYHHVGGAMTAYNVLTNSQGDVIALYNFAGNQLVASYEYDAWGNCTITQDTTGIGAINPIRYRGYYFDSEIGMYYLQSRYYDPDTGRFINADGYITTGQGVLSYNMFAYCLNNPVMYIDPSGELPFEGLLEKIFSHPIVQRILSGKLLPYDSADEAAIAFSNEVYSSSLYIRHEYATIIYSFTCRGITTYSYATPVVGEPHRVNINRVFVYDEVTVVACAHTHPNSSWFSDGDIDVANNLGIDAYVIGPDLLLKRYECYCDNTIGDYVKLISPIALTIEQKNALVDQYSVSWDNHVSKGCEFNCASIAWPTP